MKVHKLKLSNEIEAFDLENNLEHAYFKRLDIAYDAILKVFGIDSETAELMKIELANFYQDDVGRIIPGTLLQKIHDKIFSEPFEYRDYKPSDPLNGKYGEATIFNKYITVKFGGKWSDYQGVTEVRLKFTINDN